MQDEICNIRNARRNSKWNGYRYYYMKINKFYVTRTLFYLASPELTSFGSLISWRHFNDTQKLLFVGSITLLTKWCFALLNVQYFRSMKCCQAQMKIISFRAKCYQLNWTNFGRNTKGAILHSSSATYTGYYIFYSVTSVLIIK